MDEGAPDVGQLREVYKAVRQLFSRPVHYDTFGQLTHLISAGTGFPDFSCAAALLTLHDMKLIQLTLDSHPIRLMLNEMRKTDPESSAVWRRLQSWRRCADR